MPILASLFLALAGPASAAPPQAEAARLFAGGKAAAARDLLAAELSTPAAREPKARLGLLETLLDICLQSLDLACVQAHSPDYGETAGKVAEGLAPPPRLQLSRKTLVYLDHQRLATGRPEAVRAVLERPDWQAEFPGDVPLYLRRQLVLAEALLLGGDFSGATRAVDRVLSLIASLENPQESPYWTAHALVESASMLMHVGDGERAFGVYLASRELIYLGTPALSVDAVRLRLVETRLLQERNELAAARHAAEAGLETLARIEVGPQVRDRLAGDLRTLQAVICTALADRACARAAIDAHPLAAAFETARPPASYGEVSYLAARALVASVESRADPAAASALARPVAFETPGVPRDYVEMYRQAGLAMLQPPGPARAAAIRAMSRTIAGYARTQHQNAFATGYRPGVVDQILILLGLSQVEAAMPAQDREAAFALFQLVGRIGPSFDADALTRLSQARDGAERRGLHQALRLRARRDRLEREALKAVSGRAVVTPVAGAPLRYDFARRARFRDFAQGLTRPGPVLRPAANLVTLSELQAVLAPGEAAIAFSPAGGGEAAYMCVRRDRVVQARAPVDPARLQLDIKLLQAALTAGHAPSEALDVQFPVAAAVRLRQALIGPIADCLKPGDHLIWLPAPAMVPVPISVMLESQPPRLGGGWDLAQADWLVRRHAITYAMSASAFVAARRAATAGGWSFDFLGVGDPLLTGRTRDGADRTQIVLRGARGAAGLAALAPLPETRAELQQAAAGFPASRLLVGEAATERAFRRELVGSYRLMSFATHGLIRDELDGLTEPALAFTPVDAADPLDDGLLTASEIADLSLSARFVALSACNTADYDLSQFAADLPALASAFAIAGVPSTLATLWPVDSETSRMVVAGAFEGLGAAPDLSPPEALAQAQRSFLAAPPSRAHLHPRFWAPFIVLGDGPRAGRPGPAPLRIAEARQLTRGGGETLSARHGTHGVAARLIAEPEGGRFASVVQVAGPGDEGWQAVDRDVGAAELVVTEGAVLVAAGYVTGKDGRAAGVLEAFDARTGEELRTWREARPGADTAILAALPLGERGLFALVAADLEAKTPAGRAPTVRLYEVDAALAPRLLFEIAAPQIDGMPEVTLAVLGDDLLVTLAQRYGPMPTPAPPLDDFEAKVCLPAPTTWAELRDIRTGERRAAVELPGRVVTSAAGAEDGVFVGGAVQADCAEGRRASVAVLDARLSLQPWWTDAGAADSEVRALALASDGALVIGAHETLRLDHPSRAGQAPPTAEEALAGWIDQRTLGLVRLSDRAGKVSEPLVIAAGGDVFISDLDASRPGEILLGGAVGGEAAILRLARTAP
ncbi:MAG: CHAT domain-containing protein [Phenylobacterium sp.]|uniref:CHAT domain-containing protein n=1 Tax=Phenylobacterium sp. TaxID=1871053 RepID=UPI0035669AFE